MFMHKKKILIISGVVIVAIASIFTVKTVIDKKNKVDVNIVESSDVEVKEEKDEKEDKEDTPTKEEDKPNKEEEKPVEEPVVEEQVEEPVEDAPLGYSEGDAPYDTYVETSDKFEFVSDNFEKVEETEEDVIYMHVFQNTLLPAETCTEEGFYEFLINAGFNPGEFIDISCVDEKRQVYFARYDNMTCSYNFSKNKMTVTKHAEVHD